MMKKHFILLLVTSLLASCKSPEDERLEREYSFERKIDSIQMESFKIPDSVNTALIAASYADPEYKINTLLVFTDSSKSAIQKIDYLPDGKSMVEILKILKPNEYRSEFTDVDYVVEENSVSIIKVRRGGSLVNNSVNFHRTDRD